MTNTDPIETDGIQLVSLVAVGGRSLSYSAEIPEDDDFLADLFELDYLGAAIVAYRWPKVYFVAPSYRVAGAVFRWFGSKGVKPERLPRGWWKPLMALDDLHRASKFKTDA